MPPVVSAIRTHELEELLSRSTQLWRGREIARTAARSTGFAELDRLLPGGGWPVGGLIEIVPHSEGIGELSLPLAALQALSAAERPIVFVRPPHAPYAPALRRARLSLRHVVWVAADRDEDARWTAEQTLRAGVAGAVLLWSEATEDRALRRLQLAAEAGHALAFLYRSHVPAAALHKPSPAALRLALQPLADGLQVDLVKVRGGRAARVSVSLAWPASGQPHTTRAGTPLASVSAFRPYAAIHSPPAAERVSAPSSTAP